MEKIKTIEYNDLNLAWVSDYYDMPLIGLCLEDNKTCRFEVVSLDEEPTMYDIYSLTSWEWFKYKTDQKLFEFFVGKHWSYKDGEKVQEYFYIGRPNWFWKLMFWFYYKVK